MSEPPADTLRRAAEKLRGLAGAATEGPWAVGKSGMSVWVEAASRDMFVADTGDQGNEFAEADAAFTAAMHPGVALLLADWLDAEAGAHEGGMATSEGVCNLLAVVGAGEHTIQVAVSTLGQALAVARTILGEDGAR